MLTAAASLALAACGGSGGTAAGRRQQRQRGGGGEEVAVTLITKTRTNPFFIAMQKGAKEAGEKNNVTLTIAAGKADGDERRPDRRRSRTPSPAATRAS